MAKIKDTIKSIIKKVTRKKLKYYCWYSKSGKLIYCGENQKDFHKILLKNKKKYDGKNIIEFELEINSDNETNTSKLKKKKYIIRLDLKVRQVVFSGKKFRLPLRDQENSMLEITYNYNQLKNFDLSDFKYYVKIAYQGKFDSLDSFDYDEIKKELKKYK